MRDDFIKMNRRLFMTTVLGSFAAGGTAGVLVQRTGLVGKIRRRLQKSRDESPLPVAPPEPGSAFTLVALGQSNAASHGMPRGRGGAGTYAATPAGFFPCVDPLPGGSGSGGSVWTRWAALRRAAQPEHSVVVACVAQGSSRVSDWRPGTLNHGRALETMAFLREHGHSIGAIVWHQGETEAWTNDADGAAYTAALREIISSLRQAGENTPFYVCLATRDPEGIVSEAIRRAQAAVWDADTGVYAGVDTDSLGGEFRSDGAHFNQPGLELFAELMERALLAKSDRKASAAPKL